MSLSPVTSAFLAAAIALAGCAAVPSRTLEPHPTTAGALRIPGQALDALPVAQDAAVDVSVSTTRPPRTCRISSTPIDRPDAAPRDAGPVCTPGTQRCLSTGVATCGPDGQWGPSWPCVTGSCFAGACSGQTTLAPSCADTGPGLSDCPLGQGSCCLSLEVPGGTFYRDYDGISLDWDSTAYPATVSGFRLDAYEVTVARFRQFVASGASPSAGMGKHRHINGGLGLAVQPGAEPSDAGSTYEPGWNAATWNPMLATTPAGWTANLGMSYGGTTWTETVVSADGERLPISGISWIEAYAFCIWDGGFLPSETEWNYTAAGGSDQREYPWSPAFPPGSPDVGCIWENFQGCADGGATAVDAVGSILMGNGKWGHADLAGNLQEWTLDGDKSYWTPCVDCVRPVGYLADLRGGSFLGSFQVTQASSAIDALTIGRQQTYGFRCARTP